MYTVSVVLWAYRKHPRDIYPIRLQVTFSRKPIWLKTPYKISEGQWDKEARQVINHPNAAVINADLRRRVVEKEAELMAAERAGEKITADLIRGQKRDVTLEGFAREIAKKIPSERGPVVDPQVVKELNRVAAFKGAGVLLSDIDPAWLRKFDQHEQARGMVQNTRNSTFKYLRKVLKRAVAEKLIRDNPFGQFDIPAYIQTDTVYLVEEEKEALFNLLDKLTGELYNTLLYFLFACYAGPRHSDWRKFHEREMVYDGFLRLRPKKLSKGFVVMPVGPTLEGLLQRIRDLNEPPYKTYKCNNHLREIFPMAEVHMNGKVIQGIRKDATSHTARHSFGYLCASKGLPKSTTAELMGISVQTVEVYYHLSGSNIIKQAAALRDV